MDARTLETRRTPWAHRGDAWRVMWLRDGLAGPVRSHPSLLVRLDAAPDGQGIGRSWCSDYEEVE